MVSEADVRAEFAVHVDEVEKAHVVAVLFISTGTLTVVVPEFDSAVLTKYEAF